MGPPYLVTSAAAVSFIANAVGIEELPEYELVRGRPRRGSYEYLFEVADRGQRLQVSSATRPLTLLITRSPGTLRLPMPTLRPKPAIYEDVFLLGSSKSHDDVNIGGLWRRPNLGLSYLLAARDVITSGQSRERLDEVALPAAYLQRHALEVELKSCLGVVYDIARSQKWLDLLHQNPNADPPPETPIPLTHSHRELCSRLREALRVANWDELPASVVDLVESVATAEADAPERYRYDRVKVGKDKNKPLEDAFKEAVRIPVVETQHALEDVFGEVFHFDNLPPEARQTWATKLAVEADALNQVIYQNYPSTLGGPLG